MNRIMLMYRNISWWYWLVTVVFLTAGIAGWLPGFYLAIALTAVQVIHFTIRENSLTAFPVQVRFAYLIFLAAALWEPIRFLYWLPVIGTWTMVLTGYCFLARSVSIMPWNRTEPLTFSLIKRTFFSPPIRGNILRGLPEDTFSKGHS